MIAVDHLVCGRCPLRLEATLEGLLCWLVLLSIGARSGATWQGCSKAMRLGEVGLQENVEAGQMVSARLMENVRIATYLSQDSLVKGE